MTQPSGGFTASIAGVFGTRILSALASIAVARQLGPEDRGTYGLLVVGAAIGAIIATMGLEVWIASTIAARLETAGRVRAVAQRQLRSACIVAGCFVVVLAATYDRFTPLQYFLAAGLTCTTAWSMFRLAVLGGWMSMRRVALSQVLGAGAYSTAVWALLLGGAHSVAAVLASAVLSTAVLALTTGVSLRGGTLADKTSLRRARAYGRPVMTGELISQLTYRADFVVLAAISGSTAVGLYAVAVALSELLWVIPNGVSQLLLPSVAADRDAELTRSVLTVTTMAGLGVAVCLGAISGPLIRLAFGEDFVRASNAVPLLAFAAVAMGAWKLLIADLAARGNTAIRMWTGGLSLVVMVTLDLVLIEVWGIQGAAASSFAAYCLALTATLVVWARTVDVTLSSLFHVRAAIRLLVSRAQA